MFDYVIYGAPRSGTTYLAEWLYPYLYDLGYGVFLNEYFTTNEHNMRWIFDGESFLTVDPGVVTTISHSVEWLKLSPRRHLIKHISSDDRPKVIDYFAQCPVIIVQRQDIWKQVLSFGISANTHVWYTDSYQINQSYGLTMIRSQFDAITKSIMRAYDVERFPRRVIVTYEEICNNPIVLLDRLGLPRQEYDPFTHPLAPLSRKMNYDHETSFTNLDEIRQWYESVDWPTHR